MKFKAILIGAKIAPFGGKGDSVPWQTYCNTLEELETIGKNILSRLTELERKTAYIKIVEITEVVVSEIHTAIEKGKDGELMFAIAEPVKHYVQVEMKEGK